MDEVPALRPVLVDGGGHPAGERRAEERGHSRVRRVTGHPRPVDVVVAQRDRGPVDRAGPRRRQMLLGELGGRVGVPRVQRRVLADQPGAQRGAAVGAGRIEPPGTQIRHGTRPRPDHPVLRAGVPGPPRRRPSNRPAPVRAPRPAPSPSAAPPCPGRCNSRTPGRRRSPCPARPSPPGGTPRPRRAAPRRRRPRPARRRAAAAPRARRRGTRRPLRAPTAAGRPGRPPRDPLRSGPPRCGNR